MESPASPSAACPALDETWTVLSITSSLVVVTEATSVTSATMFAVELRLLVRSLVKLPLVRAPVTRSAISYPVTSIEVEFPNDSWMATTTRTTNPNSPLDKRRRPYCGGSSVKKLASIASDRERAGRNQTSRGSVLSDPRVKVTDERIFFSTVFLSLTPTPKFRTASRES